MTKALDRSSWVNGLAEWADGDTAYLSIAFTWRLDDAYTRAQWLRALGMKVIAGGPALFQPKVRRHPLDEIAEIPTKTILVDVKPKIVGANRPDRDAGRSAAHASNIGFLHAYRRVGWTADIKPAAEFKKLVAQHIAQGSAW